MQTRPTVSDKELIISLRDIQFMHRCRDGVYYLEYSAANEPVFDQFSLILKRGQNQMLAQCVSKDVIRTILIFASSIQSTHSVKGDEIGLILTLCYPPPLRESPLSVVSNESAEPPSSNALPRDRPSFHKKLTNLSSFHRHIVPFTWSIIRLVFQHSEDLETVLKYGFMSKLSIKHERHPMSTWKHIHKDCIDGINRLYTTLPFGVAFQCATLIYNLQLCPAGLLSLGPHIQGLFQEKGDMYTEDVIRQLSYILRDSEDGQPFCSFEYSRKCFREAVGCVEKRNAYLGFNAGGETGSTKCYHITMTPLGWNLQTLYLDMSNRILRAYPEHHDHFLRVSFTDEQGLPLQFKNQDIDRVKYVTQNIGRILREGFTFIGRHFQYLHYSHSSLRELTFWFMYPFKIRRTVNADTIRTNIGSEFPGQVTCCPARYGARLAQAFTATNTSITIDIDREVILLDDVERPVPRSDITNSSGNSSELKSYCFTDGVGCFSAEMGMAIHRELLLKQGGIHDLTSDSSILAQFSRPSAYQIRIGGVKGIITLNPRLSCRTICLRPSMRKFDVPHSQLEIACSFDRAKRGRLNRPLITILCGRGVSHQVFLRLQRDAIAQIGRAVGLQSLSDTGRFLWSHAMGSSFGLPATLENLHKLNLTGAVMEHPFLKRCMTVASYHMLRTLKYKAQIPIPDSWKLVGTIDEFGILKPGEIFVPVVEYNELVDVSGKVLVYKSPVIHPGDMQFATAISRQSLPPDCPLLELKNCVVFSQKGDRPLPNECSGSDLDGDMYDIISYKELYPAKSFPPMKYSPGNTDKKLEHDCRVDDIIDFVLDFMLNDKIGLISTNFLRIAEESGLHHPDCEKLAYLHSQAVDFSKTGLAVPKNEIPFPKQKGKKPDYLKPELEVDPGKTRYYPSKHVLGQLYRNVKLPNLTSLSCDDVTTTAERISTNTATRVFYIKGLTVCLENELRLVSVLYEASSGHRIREDCFKSSGLDAAQLFNYFVSKMQGFRNSYSLGRYNGERLSEEEIFVGTILAPSFDYRKREELCRSLREETGQVARQMWSLLRTGSHDETEAQLQFPNLLAWMNRAWTAWKFGLSEIQSNPNIIPFGLNSFMFVVLSSLFIAIKQGKELYSAQ